MLHRYFQYCPTCLNLFYRHCTSKTVIIIIINTLTARVAGAPQTIFQPVFSIFPCSPSPSGTCRTPGLSIPQQARVTTLKRILYSKEAGQGVLKACLHLHAFDEKRLCKYAKKVALIMRWILYCKHPRKQNTHMEVKFRSEFLPFFKYR